MLAGKPSFPQVERSFDADVFNRIVNDPKVRPYVGMAAAGDIDIAPFLANPRNVYLSVEGGALFFETDPEIGSGIYEVHTNFLPDYRGKWAIDASRAAYRWMFTHTDCMKIVTRVPANNRPAAMAARVVGFDHVFTRPKIWEAGPGELIDLKFYALSYDKWLICAAADLIASGHAFHVHFERERERLGHSGPRNHPDEDAHDLYAGACAETIYGGQPHKAVILYNRWARFAGYEQIKLVAASPLVIDIGEAVLAIGDHTFKVIKLRK